LEDVMKTYLAAAALSAALAQPALAITFPSLTTIYVGTGVVDDGGGENAGTATAFSCVNVSGVSATVRVVVLGVNGDVEGQESRAVPHGATRTWTTHLESTHFEHLALFTGVVAQGAVNIESTQSAVFCNAVVVDAADAADGFVLPLVRVNPHPGTVE
jgi:hypothetical protein